MESAVPDGGGEALSDKFLCALADIGNPGAKGFEPVGGTPFFIVRKGDEVFGYVNSCPHYGSTLEWKDDTFLNYEKDRILCSLHGALFRIEDGFCVWGPCAGDELKPLAVRVVGGNVVLC